MVGDRHHDVLGAHEVGSAYRVWRTSLLALNSALSEPMVFSRDATELGWFLGVDGGFMERFA